MYATKKTALKNIAKGVNFTRCEYLYFHNDKECIIAALTSEHPHDVVIPKELFECEDVLLALIKHETNQRESYRYPKSGRYMNQFNHGFMEQACQLNTSFIRYTSYEQRLNEGFWLNVFSKEHPTYSKSKTEWNDFNVLECIPLHLLSNSKFMDTFQELCPHVTKFRFESTTRSRELYMNCYKSIPTTLSFDIEEVKATIVAKPELILKMPQFVQELDFGKEALISSLDIVKTYNAYKNVHWEFFENPYFAEKAIKSKLLEYSDLAAPYMRIESNFIAYMRIQNYTSSDYFKIHNTLCKQIGISVHLSNEDFLKAYDTYQLSERLNKALPNKSIETKTFKI